MDTSIYSILEEYEILGKVLITGPEFADSGPDPTRPNSGCQSGHTCSENLVIMPSCYMTYHLTMRDLLAHRVCLTDDSVTLTLGDPDEIDFGHFFSQRVRYLSYQCNFREKYTYRKLLFKNPRIRNSSFSIENRQLRPTSRHFCRNRPIQVTVI